MVGNWQEGDIRGAVSDECGGGWLPIHGACKVGATLEVIQLLLESDIGKETILLKDPHWGGPFVIYCVVAYRSRQYRSLLTTSTYRDILGQTNFISNLTPA